jgi:acetylxylan esterase
MAILTKFAQVVAALALCGTAIAGTTTTVSNWGDNPSKLPALLVYAPSKLAAKPAIVLAVGTPMSPCTRPDG